MEITIGNWEVIKFSCVNDLTGTAIDNLADADNVIIQLKTPAGVIALSKELGDGVEVDTPTEGDIQLEILSNEYGNFAGAGKYPITIEIDWDGSKKQEIKLTETTENGKTKRLETITVNSEGIS